MTPLHRTTAATCCCYSCCRAGYCVGGAQELHIIHKVPVILKTAMMMPAIRPDEVDESRWSGGAKDASAGKET